MRSPCAFKSPEYTRRLRCVSGTVSSSIPVARAVWVTEISVLLACCACGSADHRRHIGVSLGRYGGEEAAPGNHRGAESCGSAPIRARQMQSLSRSVIPGRALTPHISSVFSRLFTPRRSMAWGWGSLHAHPSSTPMVAGCGQRRTNLAAPCCSPRCPVPMCVYESSLGALADVSAARRHRDRFCSSTGFRR